MAKGKKTSAKKIAEVIVEKINDPDLSTRDLEEKTGVNYRTTARIIESDMSQVVAKSDRIAKIVDNDLKTVENMSELAEIYSTSLVSRAKVDKSSVEKNELLAANTITADSFKRHQLLSGGATERTEFFWSVDII